MKKACVLFLATVLVASITACSSTSASSTNSATSSVVQSAPENKATVLSAEDVVKQLKNSGLPIDNIIVYNSDNDVNKLLGRPNQYISKVNFADTTVEQGNDKANPVGGSIETFNNAEDLKARKDYCESISKASPMFAQYYYASGNYLLRIDHAISPENAKKYEDAFTKIK